jgi:hypothetical protein
MAIKLYKQGNTIVFDNSEFSRPLEDSASDVRVRHSTTQEGLGDFFIEGPELGEHRLIIGADLQDYYGTPYTVDSFTIFYRDSTGISMDQVGDKVTESSSPESNTSFLLSASSGANIKRMIFNEGFRKMNIGYINPAVAGQGITIEPNDSPWIEDKYSGDIHCIFEYNPNGNASSETVFITSVAAFSLSILYLTLKNEAVTDVTFPAFTNLTTIEPGIYSQVGAVTPTGTITLDGDNQENPVFIFRTDGALTISANCEFILTNGATADNVYFVGDGAVTLGADSICFGNFIGLVAVTVGIDCVLNGRALSLGGAVDSSGDCYVALPPPVSVYDLGYLLNFTLFTSAGALSNAGTGNIIVGDVGSNAGAITGFGTATITGNIYDSTSEIDIPLLNGVARVINITS